MAAKRLVASLRPLGYGCGPEERAEERAEERVEERAEERLEERLEYHRPAAGPACRQRPARVSSRALGER